MPVEADLLTDFTHDGYGALLDAFAARGYRAVGYADVEPAAAQLIVRHDLDMSIGAAFAIADIEAARGIRGHYFVLMRTEMYNPWSRQGRDGLQALLDAGHEVGLHFDASLYPDDLDRLDAACVAECEALEQLLGRPVTMVSLHRPQPSLLGLKRSLGGRPHSYQPRFFSDIGYCSDSRGAWGHGRPLDHPVVAEGHALQLLTHPIWWAGAIGEDPVSRLDRFAKARHQLLRDELARNCDIYRPVAPANPKTETYDDL